MTHPDFSNLFSMPANALQLDPQGLAHADLHPGLPRPGARAVVTDIYVENHEMERGVIAIAEVRSASSRLIRYQFVVPAEGALTLSFSSGLPLGEDGQMTGISVMNRSTSAALIPRVNGYWVV
jgi:hypothetical protein